MKILWRIMRYGAVYVAGVLTLPAIGIALLLSTTPEDIVSSLETDPVCQAFNDAARQEIPQLQQHFLETAQQPQIGIESEAALAADFLSKQDWEALHTISEETFTYQEAGFAFQGFCLMPDFYAENAEMQVIKDEFNGLVDWALEHKSADYQPPDAFWGYYFAQKPGINV